MDQLRILTILLKMLEEYENTVSKRYEAMEAAIQKAVEQHYEKYGETLQESLKYSRLNSLNNKIDKISTEYYNRILKDIQAARDGSFNESYLLYAYLIHMYLSEEEGVVKKLTATVAKTSAVVALIILLLKSKKKFFELLRANDGTLKEIIQKHKADYRYNLKMDIKNNLELESGYLDIKKRINKRSLNACYYGLNRLSDVFNLGWNFATEKIYDLVKEQGGVEKIWVSRRDNRVRLQHRELDSQIADEDGYFHYGGDKAPRPKTWKDPGMNWGCRCKVWLIFNGNLPRFSKIYDYRDGAYLLKIDDRVEDLQKKGKTFLQAYQQASKEIKPPRRYIEGYITFEEWDDVYGEDYK